MKRSLIFAMFTLFAAACGGGETTTSTTSGAVVTSIPAIAVTSTTAAATTTTTTLPPTLAEPPVFDRWTTILASLPVEDWDEPAATEEAFTLVDFGSGLLLSDDYPSLNSGYWVIFSGDFATQEEALGHCRQLQDQGISCYHRYLGEAPVVVAGRAEGSFVAWVDGVLSVVDADTGSVLESVSDFYIGGGVFPGALDLGSDGTGVYFGVGFEDFWYSCEASAGRIDYVDLTSGDRIELAAGFEPHLSPDGTRLAYVASSNCIPDPANEIEVISFYDTVAVLDLITGRVQTWGPSPGVAQSPASLIGSIAWGIDSSTVYAAMEDGTLRVVDLEVGAALDATPRLGPGSTDVAFGGWTLEGVHAERGTLIAVEVDYADARSRVIEIDTVSGEVIDRGGWRDGSWVARLDGSRTSVLISGSGVVSGTPAGDLGPDPSFDGADW